MFRCGMPGHAVEKERHERHVVRSREIAIHLPELGGVGGAVIRRRLHAGQHDCDAARLRSGDDLGQILLHAGDGQAAQAVVGAELDDQDPHVAFERPVEAAQAARRRVARDAGVDDLVRIPLGVEPRLNQRRDRLFLRQAVARGEAVAEKHDARARPRRRLARALGRRGVARRSRPRPVEHRVARTPRTPASTRPRNR